MKSSTKKRSRTIAYRPHSCIGKEKKNHKNRIFQRSWKDSPITTAKSEIHSNKNTKLSINQIHLTKAMQLKNQRKGYPKTKTRTSPPKKRNFEQIKPRTTNSGLQTSQFPSKMTKTLTSHSSTTNRNTQKRSTTKIPTPRDKNQHAHHNKSPSSSSSHSFTSWNGLRSRPHEFFFKKKTHE